MSKPVIHESLYVYAADKVNGGMALAEKWRLTLVQPSGSSSRRKSVQRKSILTGVDTTGLLSPLKEINDAAAEMEYPVK